MFVTSQLHDTAPPSDDYMGGLQKGKKKTNITRPAVECIPSPLPHFYFIPQFWQYLLFACDDKHTSYYMMGLMQGNR